MIHAAAPRTHRRRHGDAGCSRSSERHLYRHALFKRPQRVEAVARARLSGGRYFGPKTPQDPATYGDSRRTARSPEVGDMVPALELFGGKTARRRIESAEALCGLVTWWHELQSRTKGEEQERHCGHQLNLELQTDLGFWLRIQGRTELLSPLPPISLAQLSHSNASVRGPGSAPLVPPHLHLLLLFLLANLDSNRT